MTTPPISEPQAPIRTATAEIAARGLRMDDGTRFVLWMRLLYDVRDPYALQLTMGERADLSDGVAWTVARETIYVGCELRTSAGQGDFSVSYVNEQTVQFVLDATNYGDVTVVLDVPRPKLSAFLQRTEVMAPIGRESDTIDLDTLVNRLMGR